MRKVLFFMMVTANGYFERARYGLDWANADAEFTRFSVQQLREVDTLLLGRVTYEGFASYWPTPDAIASYPETAERMNSLPKVVFSRSLERADWHNTRIARDAAAEVAKLKREPGGDMIVLASSDLAVSLAERGLIDEYRIMVNPVAIGEGTPLLHGLTRDLPLRLVESRAFRSGNVLLCYLPATSA
jgi:dihydrofolate reductase